MAKSHFNILYFVVLPVLLLTLAGCANTNDKQQLAPAPRAPRVELALAPDSVLPDYLHDADSKVKDAYRFAVANPDVLTEIPCYCGCVKMGHRDNLACYLKANPSGGSIEFENHAIGCGVCVDITQDVMGLMRQGLSLKSIRAYVDLEYSKYGPSTNTPPVE